MDILEYQQLMALAPEQRGVFTLADFRVLYSRDSAPTRFRKLEKLVEAGELFRVKKGVYARPDADLRVVSQRIAPDSYLSLGTVLAEEGLIGSIPGRRVWAVRPGRPRQYSYAGGVIEHLSIDPDLCFGTVLREGLRRADAEKAFLDACYFQFKGRRLPFDLLEDVDREALNEERMSLYLKTFDKRFQTYLHKLLEEK